MPDRRRVFGAIRNSSDASLSFLQWGLAGGGDPVPGDYDGDSKADSAVFVRPRTSERRNLDQRGVAPISGAWPASSGAGDYDGDGSRRRRVSPSTGFFYIWYVGSGTVRCYFWASAAISPSSCAESSQHFSPFSEVQARRWNW